MLTQRHRIAIRRHLGVPFAGTAQAGRLFGWRFEMHVEDLEYKMSNMQPAEEQLITGNAMGSYRVDGIPTVSDVLTYVITPAVGSVISVSYIVTLADLHPTTNLINPGESSPSYSIALNSALAINNAAAASGYQAVGVAPADLFSPQYNSPYFAEVIVTGPSSTPFTLSATRTGTTNLILEQQSATSPITGVVNNVTVYGYVALLDALAMGMSQANLSLTYATADVVDFRPNEIGLRKRLYKEYCVMMSRDMGGSAYVDRVNGGGLLSGGGGAIA